MSQLTPELQFQAINSLYGQIIASLEIKKKLTNKSRLRPYSRNLLTMVSENASLPGFVETYAYAFFPRYIKLCDLELAEGARIVASFKLQYVSQSEVNDERESAHSHKKTFDLAQFLDGRTLLTDKMYDEKLGELLTDKLDTIVSECEKFLDENVTFILAHAAKNLEQLLANLTEQIAIAKKNSGN